MEILDRLSNLLELPLPALILMAIGILVFAIGLLARLGWAYSILAIMLFFSASGFVTSQFFTVQRNWLYHIQLNRSMLYLMAGMALCVTIVGHSGRMSASSMRGQGIILLLMSVYAGIVGIVHDQSVIGGVVAIAFALLTIVPIILVVGALLNGWDDYVRLFRWLMLANIAWLLAVIVQIGIDPGVLTVGAGQRFVGLTANPQHAATFLVIPTIISLWLSQNEPILKRRPFWLVLFAVNAILLGWTGSRTGFAMAIIGSTFVLYGRIGRSVLYIPILGLGLMGAYYAAISMGFDLGLERLTSLKDTRTAAWSRLIESFMKSPLIGVGAGETEGTENSYLYGPAAYGVGMAFFLFTLVLVTLWLMWRLFVLRQFVETRVKMIIDMIMAFNAMLFAGAFLEPFLISRVSAPWMLACVFSAACIRAIDLVQESADEDLFAYEEDEYDLVEEYGYLATPYHDVERA